MLAAARPPIPAVVQQHADEAAHLRVTRSVLVRAPHVDMLRLRRLDDRMAAHLDGLSVSGSLARELCEAALASPGVGELFVATSMALDAKDPAVVDRLVALAESVPEAQAGLVSAFGWVSASSLRGVIKSLLDSASAFQRQVALAACAMHHADPGAALFAALDDDNRALRARALRTAGEIGCDKAIPACLAAIQDDDPECAFWAACSSVLLGNRGTAIDLLMNTGLAPGCHRARAFRLALQAMSLGAAHASLRELAKHPEQMRWLIQGSGIAGDAVYVPWLIKNMTDDKIARLAGGAFSAITGVDLGQSDLEGNPPENFEPGPNDDPDDSNVDMDPDDGLAWPDVAKIEQWWAANSSRFTPGARYFMGAPVTREHCIGVLKNGYQRQRILAAHHLCLLDPGTPLFNTSAPAWRQQRLLAKMG
jgi:uncharacterized protein (TIGR02270 family)